MLKRLLWKEWWENLWKLGFCAGVSLAFTMLLFRLRIFPDLQNAFFISLVQTIVVPVVYALDLFSGEMSNRTIHLLFKIPVPRWKIFFAKYLVAIAGITLSFFVTAAAMEVLAWGREAQPGMLFVVSMLSGLCALILMTWFCLFGCQSRSEAGSLVAMFAVMAGWGIVLFWSRFCEVGWADQVTPFMLAYASSWVAERGYDGLQRWVHLDLALQTQLATVAIVLPLACYRFVKVRRYL